MSLSDIALAMLLCTLLLLWWNAQGAKQRALQATRDYCKRMDVHLLDDAVVQRGFWFKRDEGGRLQPWRSYNFEFTSTGEQRYRGRIELLGNRIRRIELKPYRMVH